MLLTRLIFIIILFFNTLYIGPNDKAIFISPVKIPLLLSANFGELRSDHFHSGIDIKTEGVTGKEIVAAANGYVYRISVSPGGFGRALYIKHPTGFSTVYGHLERFSPEIEKYVTDQQYERKSFLVSLFPPKGKFDVKQGELIAYSGNSGSSGGPHLHYEIRKSDSEIPVNPLMFEFGTEDNIKPVIEKLVIYPINRQSLVNNDHKVKKINVAGSNGKYYIPSENEIRISGIAGFGIKSYDLLNGSSNKCSAYSIELEIDSIPLFRYVMESFSFNESRYINSHIDYEIYQREKIYVERAFKLPNDKLSVYKDLIRRGLFNFADDKIHHVLITVTDVHNNRSSLSFKIKSQSPGADVENEISDMDKDLKIMPYNKSNKFSSDNISLTIPYGALYDTLYFSYKTSVRKARMLSEMHHVHNRYTPLHKALTLSIKPDTIPAGLESKMLITLSNEDQNKIAVNSKWEDGYLTANVMTFGNYYVSIDTIAPEISSNSIHHGADLSGKKSFRFRISDDFSGIKSYEPNIDGKWALFDYDQKNNLLTYTFDEQRIKKGTKHKLSLKVTDYKDNISTYACDFTW